MLTVLVLAVSLALYAHGGLVPDGTGALPASPLGVLVTTCTALPLLLWRRRPLVVFAVTAVCASLAAAVGYTSDPTPGPIAALYLLAMSRTRERPWRPSTTGVVLALLTAYLLGTAAADGGFPGSELFHTSVAWAAAWFAGERTRLRREQLAELTERAHRVERDAERDRLLAAAEERARIARDLHDSAGHTISVIAVRAGAARLHRDPERSQAALEAIEELARSTAAEIDQLVGNLRDPERVTTPIGLASLPTLTAHHEATGLSVRTAVNGEPRALGHTADQATYRILQEALTNAARHGRGTANVTIAYTADALALTVTNPVDEASPAERDGHGLTGMRERATLLGGTFTAERRGGAHTVHAAIPYGGHQR